MKIEASPCYTMNRVLIGVDAVSAAITTDEARQFALAVIEAADLVDAARPCRFNASTGIVRRVA